jgi:tetratricopeptide (TPR) repeat protein
LIVLILCVPAYAAESAWQTYMAAGKEAWANRSYDLADKNYSLAVKEAEKSGSENVRLAESLTRLADVYRLFYAYSDAESLYQRALVIRQKLLGPDHLDVADTLSGLGDLRSWQAIGMSPDTSKIATIGPAQSRETRFNEAEKFYKRALKIREDAPGSTLEVAKTLLDLGRLHTSEAHWLADEPVATIPNSLSKSKKQRFEESEAFYAQALAIREKVRGRGEPGLVDCLAALAEAYINESKFPEASSLIQRAIAIWEKQLGLDHQDRVGQLNTASISLNNLGVLYLNKDKNEEGIHMFDEAIRLDPKYDLAYANRAIARKKLGNTTGADADAAAYTRLKSR